MVKRLRVQIPTGGTREFSSPELTFCADSFFYGVHSAPCVATVAHKRPWSFCQKFRWQVTSKHIPLTQRSLSGLIMPLSRHSVGTYRETSSQATHRGTLTHSSQLAEPLWTDPGLKSGIRVHKLISTLFLFYLLFF